RVPPSRVPPPGLPSLRLLLRTRLRGWPRSGLGARVALLHVSVRSVSLPLSGLRRGGVSGAGGRGSGRPAGGLLSRRLLPAPGGRRHGRVSVGVGARCPAPAIGTADSVLARRRRAGPSPQRRAVTRLHDDVELTGTAQRERTTSQRPVAARKTSTARLKRRWSRRSCTCRPA